MSEHQPPFAPHGHEEETSVAQDIAQIVNQPTFDQFAEVATTEQIPLGTEPTGASEIVGHHHSHHLHHHQYAHSDNSEMTGLPPGAQLPQVQPPTEGAPNVASLHHQQVLHNDGTGSPPAKKQRRRYDNNFKAAVLDHLKNSRAKLPAIAKQYGIPENTLREWTKITVVESIQNARLNHGGTLKANMHTNPMNRLAESLMVFFSANDKQPQGLRQPITPKLIVSKGLEARKKLLELHDIQPFLDPKEKRTLESFTGSDSWAKKFARRHSLKLAGHKNRVRELADNDIKVYCEQLRQIAQRMKQAGPGYEDIAVMLFQAGDKLETRTRALDVQARVMAAHHPLV
ncbi:MAG: hypothetical protein SGBAC_006125 [Bacillariaceae sp.]